MRSIVSLILCVTLSLSALLTALVPQVQAKSARTAQIVDLSGTVEVKKAGGSKAYSAFADMYLNEGDYITTGPNSSVILKVVDQQDEVTIGENSEMYISSLTEDGGKKSKFKMWVGSLWFKVKKLVAEEDEFEIETPTAVMGVRGSNGYIESKLQQVFAMMASGILSTQSITGTTNNQTGGNTNNTAYVYPGQQVKQVTTGNDNNQAVQNLFVQPLNIKEFVASAPPEIIQKAITTIAEIRQENTQFVRRLEQGHASVDANSALKLDGTQLLQKFSENLDNLVANIAKTAIDEQKLPKEQVEQIIQKVNEQLTQPIDLNNVKPFDPTIGIDPEKQKQLDEQLQRLEQQRLQKLEEQRRLEEQRKQEFAAIEKALEEQRKKTEEENRKAKEEEKRKAEEEYKQKLSEEQKRQFEQERQKKEEELKQRESQSQQNNNNNSQTDTQQPTSTTPTSTSRSTPKNVTSLRPSQTTVSVNQPFYVDVRMQNFSAVYGVELHFLYDSDVSFTGAPNMTSLSDSFVFGNDMTNKVEHWRQESGTYNGAAKNELIYAVTRDSSQTTDNLSFTNDRLLVRVPLLAKAAASGKEIKMSIKVVDHAGNPVVSSEQTFTINVQ